MRWESTASGEVVAHRADRFLGVLGQRRQDHPQVLLCVAERQLAGAQRLDPWHARRALRQVREVNDPGVEPLGVRLARGEPALDLVVVDDPVLLEVDEEDLPRLEPALAEDVLRRIVEHARLGAEHDPAVLRLEPAARAEAVAVERRADHGAVAERDRGRPVPRLHQAAVEVVEAAQLLAHVLAAVVGLGDHHHQRVRQRAAREHEQLEHVVEVRRVGAARPYDRQHLLQVVAEELRGELRLARPHPVDVAAQRVDLAVVRDHPVRVRELPARERVRREARVHERERALEALVAQVGIEARELRRGQHPLVDERPGREARDDELRPGRELGDAPDDVELPLERVLIRRELGRGCDDELLDDWRDRACRLADVREIERDVAPADDALAFRGDGRLERGARARPRAPGRPAAGSRPRRRTGPPAAAPPRRRRGRARRGAGSGSPRRRPSSRRLRSRRGARGSRAP